MISKNIKKIVKKYSILAVLSIIIFSGCAKQPVMNNKLKVGFDVDDTLLFSTPAFKKGFDSDVKAFSSEYWIIVNKSDREHSIIKKKTAELLKMHQLEGDEVFIITARHPDGGDVLKEFLTEIFNVPAGNIFFETEGKKERLKRLGLNVYYGDSDSDISAAINAGVKPFRILRTNKSSYKKKFNPGAYGEEIITGSEW